MVILRLPRAELPGDGWVSGGPTGPEQHAAAQQSRLAQPLRRVEERAQRVSNGAPGQVRPAWYGQQEQGKYALPCSSCRAGLQLKAAGSGRFNITNKHYLPIERSRSRIDTAFARII